MPKVRLTNIGPGARGMYDINHAPFEVRPGEFRDVELHEADVEHLRKMDAAARLQNKREYLQVGDIPDDEEGTKVVDVSQQTAKSEAEGKTVDGTKPGAPETTTTHVGNLTETGETNLTETGGASTKPQVKKTGGARG